MIVQLVVTGIDSLPMTFARDIIHACKRANMPIMTKQDRALYMKFRAPTEISTLGVLTFRATKLDISSAPAINFKRVEFLVARELEAKGWPASATYVVTEYTP